MRCRKKFSGQNGDSIAGRKPFISRSNFTLWRCIMHPWKADTLSYMAVPITSIRPFTKCGSFWLHQSYLFSVNLVTTLVRFWSLRPYVRRYIKKRIIFLFRNNYLVLIFMFYFITTVARFLASVVSTVPVLN